MKFKKYYLYVVLVLVTALAGALLVYFRPRILPLTIFILPPVVIGKFHIIRLFGFPRSLEIRLAIHAGFVLVYWAVFFLPVLGFLYAKKNLTKIVMVLFQILFLIAHWFITLRWAIGPGS